MIGSDLESLRAAASRSDYLSMVRFAVALAEHGHNDRAIIRACYGVDFPEEFYLLARDHWEKFARSTNLPWQLVASPERRRRKPYPDPTWSAELEAFAIDPGLIPIDELNDDDVLHGGSLICYHLDELAEGRSTIFGLTDRGGGVVPAFDPDAVPERYGPSWLAVLHDHTRDQLRVLKARYDEPSNFGFGSIGDETIEQKLAEVRFIEELQERLATFGADGSAEA